MYDGNVECFFVHKSLKTDIKKENDKRKGKQ